VGRISRAGNFLYKSAPSGSSWDAGGKDQWISDAGTMTAYAMELNDPDSLYVTTTVTSLPSAASTKPVATATLPPGYVMTGGGCFVDWESAPNPSGTFFQAHTPTRRPRRIGTVKVNADQGNAAQITAYVIGVKPVSTSTPMPTMTIVTATAAQRRRRRPTNLSNTTFVTAVARKLNSQRLPLPLRGPPMGDSSSSSHSCRLVALTAKPGPRCYGISGVRLDASALSRAASSVSHGLLRQVGCAVKTTA